MKIQDLRRPLREQEHRCRFVTSCVGCDDVPALEDMIDNAKEISYKEFVRNVSEEQLAQEFPDYDWHGGSGLTMKKDYHVRYYKSTYQTLPAFFVDHSAIEYVWVCE